ncbi:MAG: hypothetical protein ACJ75B_18615 [Flavisolibacter sp.]
MFFSYFHKNDTPVVTKRKIGANEVENFLRTVQSTGVSARVPGLKKFFVKWPLHFSWLDRKRCMVEKLLPGIWHWALVFSKRRQQSYLFEDGQKKSLQNNSFRKPAIRFIIGNDADQV